MTGAEALAELLDRLGAARDGTVLIDELEVGTWPAPAVNALKNAGLLTAAADASSVVCPGCERQCSMPVESLPGTPFVVCDKRTDINRVPIEPDSLRRWQASGEAVAVLLARLLRLRRRSGMPVQTKRWEVGTVRGAKRSGHLVLTADGVLKLSVSGHTLVPADVLSLRGSRLTVDEAALKDCVANPASGGGDTESARQRRSRLMQRVEQLKGQRKDFFKAVAMDEGITPQRLRQIVGKSTT